MFHSIHSNQLKSDNVWVTVTCKRMCLKKIPLGFLYKNQPNKYSEHGSGQRNGNWNRIKCDL